MTFAGLDWLQKSKYREVVSSILTLSRNSSNLFKVRSFNDSNFVILSYLSIMPYATRQGTIDFPKRKLIVRSKSQKILDDVKKTPESKVFSPTSVSSSARKAFHSSLFGGIVGREKELRDLKDFLMSHLENQTSGSLYVSGLPGTGKTASVNFIIDENELSKKYHIVKINCTSFNSSKAVFKRICEELKLKTNAKTEKESINSIEKFLLRKHKMILLILDEIDQLESKSQSVLYKIFEWPSWKDSKFVLIGIANAMDLTDRNLPRLCCKVELKPMLLHFAPYTKDEIADILKKRLTEVGADKIFAPGAIELISAKVAGSSGDVRRALDLGKRVIEVAEQKNQKDSESNVINNSRKTVTNESSPKKMVKRKIESSPCKTPSKIEFLVNKIIDSANNSQETDYALGLSPKKLFKTNKPSDRMCLGEKTPQKSNLTSEIFAENKVVRKSPRKFVIEQGDIENLKQINNRRGENSPLKKSPVKSVKDELSVRKSPRKLTFDVDSRDVLTVVKTAFGSSRNFKPTGESSFPLHQKLLICTLMLLIKKGKKKDLNVGKLHQVYSKVCSKRGVTAVDKSGFLFLCRQVEVTGVLQIGRGPGTLAKVTLQWDESEVINSLKDLNMLSSILNDTSCIT